MDLSAGRSVHKAYYAGAWPSSRSVSIACSLCRAARVKSMALDEAASFLSTSRNRREYLSCLRLSRVRARARARLLASLLFSPFSSLSLSSSICLTWRYHFRFVTMSSKIVITSARFARECRRMQIDGVPISKSSRLREGIERRETRTRTIYRCRCDAAEQRGPTDRRLPRKGLI